MPSGRYARCWHLAEALEKGGRRAIAMPQIRPVAPLPWVLGVVRKRDGAGLIETCGPPPSAPLLSGGRGGEALLLALRDGHPALSQVGARREDRGLFPFLPPGLTRPSLPDDRRGQRLAGLWVAHLQRLCGASALTAVEVSTLASPGLPPDTTTLPLDGAYKEEPPQGAGPVPPCPA